MNNAMQQDVSGLIPLPYHLEVVYYLKANEPDVWSWASSLSVQEQHADEVRSNLLRESYRLTVTTHPELYEAASVVLSRLGIDAPVTLYQAGNLSMNATLYFLPGEAHVMFHGPILERLDPNEILALLGHELAHYKLWSDQSGDFLIADRILHHTTANYGASPSYEQTARLYGLYTEVYADRGAALASQSSFSAITTLVKVDTGIATVDAPTYLKQALELDKSSTKVSSSHTHPETFLRSQAVDQWWRREPETDSWLHKRLRGEVNLDKLGITDQEALTKTTRSFIAFYLTQPKVISERVMTRVKTYFPDWAQNESPILLNKLVNSLIDSSVHDYLHHVMLDLALVDPEISDEAISWSAEISAKLGTFDQFISTLKRDLKMNKREVDKLTRFAKESVST